jgi:hypothetical protein
MYISQNSAILKKQSYFILERIQMQEMGNIFEIKNLDFYLPFPQISPPYTHLYTWYTRPLRHDFTECYQQWKLYFHNGDDQAD